MTASHYEEELPAVVFYALGSQYFHIRTSLFETRPSGRNFHITQGAWTPREGREMRLCHGVADRYDKKPGGPGVAASGGTHPRLVIGPLEL